MDAVRFARTIRALRRRRGWRQVDVAAAAGVSQDLVSRLERGHMSPVRVASLLAVTGALEAELVVDVRWHGERLDRLLDHDHAALVESVIRRLSGWGWLVAPEVSFSIYGERGSVDVLAYHPATRTVLVIEVKSVVPDIQAMLAALDRKTRLGRRIAHERRWDAAVVARILVLADRTSSRERVALHEKTLLVAFGMRGVELRRWLRDPHTQAGGVSGLWFVRLTRGSVGMCARAGSQRVRCPRSCSGEAVERCDIRQRGT